jgi:hypothetical protein
MSVLLFGHYALRSEGKHVPVHVIKAYCAVELQKLKQLNSALDAGSWPTKHSGRFIAGSVGLDTFKKK